MDTKNKLLVIAAAVIVAACGGGSSAPVAGSSPPPPPVSPPPPANQAPGGLWFGTLTYDNNMTTEDFVALISDDGRFRFVSVDSEVQFHGQAAVTGSSLSGTGRAFADSGVNWLDGSHVTDATITAVVSQRNSISGGWAIASGESGTFALDYDALYEKDSSVSLLTAVWTGYDDLGNPNATFTIDADGSFNGQNAQGCVSIGQFSVIDPLHNLYAVNSDISGCPIGGTYSGFAVLADFLAVNDLLAISIDNGVFTIVVELEK